MKIIGVTGGVASGKSLVACQLESLGALRLDADRAGHEVLREDPVRRALQQRWGPAVVGEDGQIDRGAVARIVFESSPRGARELEFLEQLTHPRIAARLQQQLEQAARDGQTAVVLDAAVMFKAGWHKLCDAIVFVDAERKLRWQRAARRGWSRSQFAARERAQHSLDVKRQQADFRIDNSGTPESTLAQVKQLWNTLFSPGETPCAQESHSQVRAP